MNYFLHFLKFMGGFVFIIMLALLALQFVAPGTMDSLPAALPFAFK